jgi:hypothetical protein
MADCSFRAHREHFRAERTLDRFQPARLIVEIAQIVPHEGDEPDALAHLRHADVLAGKEEHPFDAAAWRTRTSTGTSSGGFFAKTRSLISSAFKTWASLVRLTPQFPVGRRPGAAIVTHDISTLAKHAFDRIAAGQPMPGVFAVRSVATLGQAIDDLILVTECSFEGE